MSSQKFNREKLKERDSCKYTPLGANILNHVYSINRFYIIFMSIQYQQNDRNFTLQIYRK